MKMTSQKPRVIPLSNQTVPSPTCTVPQDPRTKLEMGSINPQFVYPDRVNSCLRSEVNLARRMRKYESGEDRADRHAMKGQEDKEGDFFHLEDKAGDQADCNIGLRHLQDTGPDAAVQHSPS